MGCWSAWGPAHHGAESGMRVANHSASTRACALSHRSGMWRCHAAGDHIELGTLAKHPGGGGPGRGVGGAFTRRGTEEGRGSAGEARGRRGVQLDHGAEWNILEREGGIGRGGGRDLERQAGGDSMQELGSHGGQARGCSPGPADPTGGAQPGGVVGSEVAASPCHPS